MYAPSYVILLMTAKRLFGVWCSDPWKIDGYLV